MRRLTPLPLLLLALWLDQALCWNLRYQGARKTRHEISKFSQTRRQSSAINDYEYEPPRRGQPSPLTSSPSLPSSYPDGTPVSLKGEAVRSALCSSRCIGWNLQGTPLEFGLVRVQGAGTLDFCQSKLTKSFNTRDIAVRDGSGQLGSFRQACLLTSRGHVVDRIGVGVSSSDNTFLLTSPGHSSRALWDRLDPFVFALDQVELSTIDKSCIFTLASTQLDHVQSAFDQFIQPSLRQEIRLPKGRQCTFTDITSTNGHDIPSRQSFLLVLPTTLLPGCAGRGYTFCFLNQAAKTGQLIWENLVADSNAMGPIEVGAQEFQTLQIESGWPAFGFEMTGHIGPIKGKSSAGESARAATPASPLELHLESLVDQEKGCYLGQEGIASTLKNPRGPPRSLYQVIFDDDFNVYEYESAEDDPLENLTRIPRAGDALYVLGSNQEISVGIITSVAETGGTGDKNTVGLALIRRSDSILKQMASKDIKPDDSQIRKELIEGKVSRDVIRDPLDGLEVIIGDSFTVGRLRTIPSRRCGPVNMFDEEVIYDDAAEETIQTAGSQPDLPVVDAVVHSPQELEAEAAAVDAEAQRKVEKMEMLRKRAEEALARRKNKTA